METEYHTLEEINVRFEIRKDELHENLLTVLQELAEKMQEILEAIREMWAVFVEEMRRILARFLPPMREIYGHLQRASFYARLRAKGFPHWLATISARLWPRRWLPPPFSFGETYA